MSCSMTAWMVAWLLVIAPPAWADRVADPTARAEHVSALLETLDTDPGDIGTCLDYAENAALDLEYDAALAALERCQKANPREAQLVAQQGRLLIMAVRADEAFSICQAHLNDRPDDAEVEIVLLLSLTRMPGRMEPVLERVNALTEQFPAHPDLMEARARIAGRANQFEEAAEYYRLCLDAEPLRPVTLMDAAVLALSRTDRPDAAMRYLRQAGAVSPRLPVWSMTGLVAMMLGHTDEAVDAYQTAIEYGEDPINNAGHLAQVYMRTFQFHEALGALNTALAEHPNHIGLLLARSSVNLELGQDEASLADIERMMVIAPRDPGPYRNRAIMHINRGDFEAALADARSALERGSRDPIHLSFFEQAQEAVADERAARRLAEQLDRLPAGYERALKEYRESVRLRAYHYAALSASVALQDAESADQRAQALRNRSRAYRMHGWVNAALDDLEAAAAEQPENVRLLLELADSLMSIPGRLEEARAYAARAHALSPRQLDTTLTLAMIEVEDGQFDAARGLLEMIDPRHSENPRVLSAWTHYYEATGEYGQAADIQARLDEAGGLSLSGLERWAYNLYQAGRLVEAESVARRYVQVRPGDVDAWVRLAYLRVLLGRFAEAGDAIEESEGIEPRSFIDQRTICRAMIAAATEGIDTAMHDIEQLQHHHPSYIDLDQTVMWCLLFEGRYDEALARADHWLEHALPRHSQTGCDIPLRVMALRAKGNNAGAQAVLADPRLQERAGSLTVRAWVRLQEVEPGEFLPPEELDEDQQEQVGQLLPFFLAMGAWLNGDAESFTAHLSELRRNQYRAASIGQHLIIAYLAREYWPEDSD